MEQPKYVLTKEYHEVSLSKVIAHYVSGIRPKKGARLSATLSPRATIDPVNDRVIIEIYIELPIKEEASK